MMEKGYRPTGWLGLILGTRLYFSFHAAAIGTDAAFTHQVDLVERDLGDRGKAPSPAKLPEKLPEGLPPCLLYTSPSPRDGLLSRMPSSA